jgi:predicted P-loop ATPase
MSSTDFMLNHKCNPLGNPFNVRLALTLSGVKLSHNLFSAEDLIEGFDGYGPHFDDAAAAALRTYIWDTYGVKVNKGDFDDILSTIARKNRFHPVLNYLDGLKWDGVPRLENWLTAYLGVPDDRKGTARFMGKATLVAAVRRVRKPGTKFDTMLVLEGKQGKGKSTAISLLCHDPAWFTDNVNLGIDTKQLMEVTSGKLIVEMPEMAGMSKAEDKQVKGMLTRQVDSARSAYGRRTGNRPRQFIFIGTTNEVEGEYLPDKTGNRRYWPVVVRRIDLAAIERDRDQLWAEACFCEARGDQIFAPKELKEALEDVQAKRQMTDEWDGIVASHLAETFPANSAKTAETTIADVAKAALSIFSRDLDPATTKRLIGCMRRTGWKKVRASHGVNYWGREAAEGEEPEAPIAEMNSQTFDYDAPFLH